MKSESSPKAGKSSPCNEKQVSCELGNVRQRKKERTSESEIKDSVFTVSRPVKKHG